MPQVWKQFLSCLDAAFGPAELLSFESVDMYREFGWNDIPAYMERRQRHEAYRHSERRKFLAVACGDDGFAFWQPSAESCAEIDSI